MTANMDIIRISAAAALLSGLLALSYSAGKLTGHVAHWAGIAL